MEKIDSLNQVAEFHRTFNAPILDTPQIPSKERCDLRVSLLQEEGTSIEESFVRVGVTSGGCSGLNYNLEFTKEQSADDKLFDDNNVRILVDKKSFLYLVGMTLEYSGGLNGKGFVFNNPNASRTCGCGESFAV